MTLVFPGAQWAQLHMGKNVDVPLLTLGLDAPVMVDGQET